MYNYYATHYNKRGVYCDPNIIANNKEKSFWKPTVANHNFSQTLKLLRNHNICTRTIASFSQLPKLIQSQNFSDYNFFYTSFAIPSTSEIICNKPIHRKDLANRHKTDSVFDIRSNVNIFQFSKCRYPFAIHMTSETICSKFITAKT